MQHIAEFFRFQCPYIFFLFFLVFAWKIQFGQANLQSSDLPIVVIDTNGDSIIDDPRINAHMGIIAGTSQNHISDPFNEYQGRISIEIRGSSSQSFPKKSYGLETQKENGENQNVSLLGMPKENDWILHGPYSDKSLLRNRLAFELGSSLSQYAPRTRLVELVINQDYKGVYVFMEKIKRDKNRVAISKLYPDTKDADSISGGYIIKLDKETGSSGGEGWESADGNFFQYEYPTSSDINRSQAGYIRNFIDSLEHALFSNLYQDPQKGYRKYLDLESFVDFVIINELSKNVDAYRLSTFFNKERGEKLKAGPMWDYNLAFGNANYCVGESPLGWVLNFNLSCPQDGWTINNYWDRLLSDPFFGEAIISRWRELRKNRFQTDSILNLVDNFLLNMKNAPERNFQRWPILDRWIWPNIVVEGSYEGEINYLKNWLLERLRWIDNNIEGISHSVRGASSWPKFEIYPNPFNDYLDIGILNTISEPLIFEVYDLQGRVVAKLGVESERGYTRYFRLDASSVLPGIYIYRLLSNGHILKNGKLMKY